MPFRVFLQPIFQFLRSAADHRTGAPSGDTHDLRVIFVTYNKKHPSLFFRSFRYAVYVGNFAAGKYVFYASTIYPGKDANMQIREMEDTYGLLPIPKYDLDQDQYGTTATDGYSLMGVLDHSESTIPTKGKAVSAYLQLMTEESYTSVRGYYFNRIIKPKYFGTDDSEGTVTNSIALFDIIVDNIEFEYWTVYSAQLNNIAWLWRDSFRDFVPSLEAGFKAKADAYDDAIKSTDAWLGLRDAE